MITLSPSYLSLELNSSKRIKNTYKIDKIKNYKIVSFNEDEEIEILAIDIDKESFISNIIFTTRDCTNNKKFILKLLGFNFEFEDGEICKDTNFDYISTTEKPTVIAVKSTSPITMNVYFTKEMIFNKDILNINRYKFLDNSLKVLGVEREDEYSVKLLTTKQIPGKLYQLQVL